MKRFFLKLFRTHEFSEHRDYWVLAGICTLFVLLRLPSLIEPHWYGDEGIYQVVGLALNDGRLLYRDIWDNKPPLLYIIYAFAQADLFVVKLLSLLSGFFSIIFFFLLTGKLFKKRISGYIATIVYAVLFGAPILEGNIANAENFMLLPIVAAAYFVYSYSQDKKTGQLVIAGLLLSLAFLTKTVALFDFAAFFTFLFLSSNLRMKRLSDGVLFVFSFLSVPILTALYFLFAGAFSNFIGGVFLQNVSYVSEQYGASNPAGMMAVKSLLLLLALSALFIMRKKIPIGILFIYAWVAFGIYNAFFSDRPYIHYLLVLLPAFSLLVGLLFEKIKIRFISIVLIVIIALFSYYHFTIYKKNVSYYMNYLAFMINNKSITEYQNFFDRNVPRDYKIANFITAHVAENETVFLLSDSAQIYALTDRLPIGKYIVAYHISYYPDAITHTEDRIKKSKPKYIIHTTAGPLFEEVLSSYELKYIMDGARIYERKI